MTADQISKILGCSRAWVFILQKKYPKEAPSSFNDIEGWKNFYVSVKSRARVKHVRGASQPSGKVAAAGNGFSQISDIQRLTAARASKTETELEILRIELEATKREIVSQAEVTALFAQLATVVKGRFLKLRNDLPNAVTGLDPAQIDRILGERMEEILGPFKIPQDFFETKGRV